MRKAPFECPQDRLRQAQGERTREAALRRGVGVRWGTETPRAALLWIPAFAGMTRAGEAPFECPQDRLRQAQGERILEARLWWGVGDAMGDGDAPRLVPLDSCLRRNDACGRLPSSALRTGFDRLRTNGRGERPYDGSRGCDVVGDAPRLAPLVSCLRRNDATGEGDAGVAGGGGPPSTGSGRTDAGIVPTDWVGVLGPTTVACGGGAPPLWILAFAGMSRGEAFGELVADVLQEGWVVTPIAPDPDPDVQVDGAMEEFLHLQPGRRGDLLERGATLAD